MRKAIMILLLLSCCATALATSLRDNYAIDCVVVRVTYKPEIEDTEVKIFTKRYFDAWEQNSQYKGYPWEYTKLVDIKLPYRDAKLLPTYHDD